MYILRINLCTLYQYIYVHCTNIYLCTLYEYIYVHCTTIYLCTLDEYVYVQKSKVKNYLFMKYNKNIQSVSGENILKSRGCGNIPPPIKKIEI